MPQFITHWTLEYKDNGCAHEITPSKVFQDYGDKAHRACWTLVSKCRKCGTVFVYGSGFGLFDDLNQSAYKTKELK